MNSLAPTTTARQPDFVVAIQEAEISPFLLGCLDAERNELCVPEMYYSRQGQMLEYAEGFESVAGETLLSAQAKRLLGAEPRVAVTHSDIETAINALFARVADDGPLPFEPSDDDTTDYSVNDPYGLGQIDALHRRYAPPNCVTDVARYDAYVRGWNDAWATSADVTLVR